jgi:cell division protein ZapA (FtsZ GTPase activity inhibitor)
MKQYLEHLKTRSTHERRVFSMQAAGVITAVLVVMWLATLSLRLTSSGESEKSDTQNTAATLLSY